MMYSTISGDLQSLWFVNVIGINVAQQLKESVGSVRHYDISERTEEGLSIYGKVQLLRTDRSILVTGSLETGIGGVCSRCLEQFDHPLTLDIEEEYLLPKDAAGGLSPASPSETSAFAIDENNILDLSEAVRQLALLSLPMKPICRRDCAGLCPQCGCNLNKGKCDCVPVRPDSRWAQLQGLASRE